MDWLEEYKRKLVSAAEAVGVVKSGDRVEISILPTPSLLPLALHERRAELRGVERVRVIRPTPRDGFPTTRE